MAVVTLLSDFIDGTSMALAEDTDAADLNAFMTANQGRLWASVQQRRRQRQQTIERRGPGTVYFAADAPGAAAVERYLGSDTGSAEEAAALQAMRSAGVEIAPHVGADRERDVLLNGRLKDLTAQAKAKRVLVEAMGDAAMTLPENPLGLQSFDELVEWTVSYLHFKHALEVIAFTPEAARSYLDRFSAFSSRYATEMKKQDILEARLPKEMRESIEAENAHRALLRELLNG